MNKTLDKEQVEKAKTKITEIIKQYIRLFPSEYEAFKRSVAPKKENDFAEIKGSDIIERQLYELPETLHYALRKGLEIEEWAWLQNDTLYGYARNRGGVRWFIRAFPEFKITKEW